MKHYLKIIKRITVILLIVVIIFCLACGCDWGWNWRGPYHHAAILSTPKKTVLVGEETYSLIDEKLYKHNNGQLEKINLNYDQNPDENARDLASGNGKLYLVIHNEIFSLQDDKLNLIYSGSSIYSLTADKGNIYFVMFQEEIENKYKYELCSYDLELKTKETLCEFSSVENHFVVNSKIIAIGNLLLFMDERMNLFWVDSLAEQNRASLCLYPFMDDVKMFERISFALGEDIAYLEIVEQGVRFQYKQNVYEYLLQANQLRLYPIVKVIEGKVYFALNDWLKKEDCQERTDCICQYHSSMLIAFDLENKQFSIEKQIGEREIFVDFDKDECIYYAKGAIYKNESVLRQLQEIYPDVPYKIVEGTMLPRPVYELKLAYNFGQLNYLLIDNHDYLLNEYA